jgi:hypothetical protein
MSSRVVRPSLNAWLPRLAWVVSGVNVGLFAVQLYIWGLPPSMLGSLTAMFQPVRGRVQTLVDRRFYRAKYDAARTLQQFASEVRDQVELHQLQLALVGVVHEIMQPAHVSLWLRPSAASTHPEHAR